MSAENVTRMGVTPVPHIALPREPSRSPRRPSLAHLITFGAVGGVSFVVDVGVYNFLRVTLLTDQPIGAKVVSVAVATVVAFLGNRLLTFRDRRGGPLVREAALFAATNVLGLVVAAACLFVSHYLLGFHSTLADNISGNVVGLVAGMLVRYFGYRFIVFRHP